MSANVSALVAAEAEIMGLYRYASENIESRDHLYAFLERRMQHSYEQLNNKREVETGSFFVKSFLLECDWNTDGLGRAGEKKYLRDLLSIRAEGRQKKKGNAEITEADESGLYTVDWDWNKEKVTLFIDTISDSKRRFWRAYSVSKATPVDDIISRLIESKKQLDRTWLWSNLLESTQVKSQTEGFNCEPRGFRFEHNSTFFDKESDGYQPSEPFKLKFSGNREESKTLLDLINKSESLSHQTSLSNVRMKYSKLNSRKDFAIETLYFNGKFTTNGTSFTAHQRLMDDIQNRYSKKVYQIENDYTIVTSANEQEWQVSGKPVVLDLADSQISDIDSFCKVVFSGRSPFMLWGTPREISGGEGRVVHAVDLHVGAKLFFEIYPEIICMYLSAGACGNTAIRFYTNLQKYFSRLVNVQDEFGNQLF